MRTEEELKKKFERCIYEVIPPFEERFRMYIGKVMVEDGKVMVNDSIIEKEIPADVVDELYEMNSAVRDGFVYIIHIGKYYYDHVIVTKDSDKDHD